MTNHSCVFHLQNTVYFFIETQWKLPSQNHSMIVFFRISFEVLGVDRKMYKRTIAFSHFTQTHTKTENVRTQQKLSAFFVERKKGHTEKGSRIKFRYRNRRGNYFKERKNIISEIIKCMTHLLNNVCCCFCTTGNYSRPYEIILTISDWNTYFNKEITLNPQCLRWFMKNDNGKKMAFWC